MPNPDCKKLIHERACPLSHETIQHCRKCRHAEEYNAALPGQAYREAFNCRHRKAGQETLFSLENGALFDLRVN